MPGEKATAEEPRRRRSHVFLARTRERAACTIGFLTYYTLIMKQDVNACTLTRPMDVCYHDGSSFHDIYIYVVEIYNTISAVFRKYLFYILN